MDCLLRPWREDTPRNINDPRIFPTLGFTPQILLTIPLDLKFGISKLQLQLLLYCQPVKRARSKHEKMSWYTAYHV